MLVMPANSRKAKIMYLAGQYRERYGYPVIGQLYAPRGWKNPLAEFPYALDNGAWPAYKNGVPYQTSPFINLCNKAAECVDKPLWVVVPDVVGDRKGTLASWELWAPVVKKYGWPLALAVQDGMTVEDIENLHIQPDVLFIGGTTEWKRGTIHAWCEYFPRVHVGRINTLKWLWYCFECGAESIDGTGWFFNKQLNQLHSFLENMKNVVEKVRVLEEVKVVKQEIKVRVNKIDIEKGGETKMRFLEDADRYRLTLKEQEAYFKEVKKYSKQLEKENAAMHNLLVEFALKNDILPDIAFQMPALKGQKLQLKIGSKFTVVNEKAYDVIDAEEEGLVKRSIHWQTLQTFMKNCDESSRKILLSEEFIAEDETHSVKLL